ncbi:MAG: cation-transporting P-type ATPase [Pseudomonadota bacterium]
MQEQKSPVPETETSTIQSLPVREVYTRLSTTPSGLTGTEAEERLRKIGPNVVQRVKPGSLIAKFLANFVHLMAILLWVAGITAFVARLPQLGWAIWMVNLINGAFSFWQEFKAEKATEALLKLLPSYARVLRDGGEKRVLAEGLVHGDVILLSEGDRISADARLVYEAELRIDQSTFTGESRPVRKTSEASYQPNISRPEIPNLVFAGTNVVAGSGKAVVFNTGMNTEFGKIAGLTQRVGEEPSPLQKEMKRVTKVVSAIAIGMGILFFIMAAALTRISLAESFIFGIGIIVAFIPEGLLPTVTLALAMGVQRMAKRNALIKKLSAVETLGSTTVICTDKTGTLTQNEMTVTDICLPGRFLRVSGVGYSPEGSIMDETHAASVSSEGALGEMLFAAGLCNNSKILPPDTETLRWTVLGDPTEAALKVAAAKGGIDLDAASKAMPRIREIPFESHRRMMSTIHQSRDSWVVYVKGASREVLAASTRILLDGKESELDDKLRSEIMAANDDYARRGLRVLAVAERTMFQIPAAGYKPDAIETDLTFLGLMAMMDPPRPEVLDAVTKCHSAGIRIIMITGDYGLTAENIARRIGIVEGEKPVIITGTDIEGMDDPSLKESLRQEVIVARAAPSHKLRVVGALQQMGHVVAVTGDGVNDAPALKKADIGVAMGVAGTDVAKEAADMILTDDNFASIVNAVEEGRAVFANIKKFTSYIFTSNTPEIVPFVLFALSGSRIPLALNVMHILAIDLGTDMMPALGLGADPPEPGVMNRPPRALNEHVITVPLLLRAYLWLGPVQALAAMAAFYFQYWTHGYWGQWMDLPGDGDLYRSATAMALAAVVTTQIGNLFAQRAPRVTVFRIGFFTNRLVWIGIATEMVIILAIVYVPFIQDLIGTEAFAPKNWLFLFAWTPSLLIVDELRKAVLRKWKKE